MRKFIKKYSIFFSSICTIFVVYITCIYFYKFSDVLTFNRPKVISSDAKVLQTFSTDNAISYESKDFYSSTYIKATIPRTDYNPIVYILSDKLDVSYLTNYLASFGYLCFNLIPSDIYDLENVFKEINSSFDAITVDFGNSLINKGDKGSVSIIGIGKAGNYVFNTALFPPDSSLINLVSTLLIAPYINFNNNQKTIPTAPIGVVLPEFDGITRNLDGQTIYNNYLFSEELLEPISILYLFGANYNFFYETPMEDDALNIEVIKNPPDDIEQIFRLSKQEQQNFLRNYTLEFLNFYQNGKVTTNIGLNSGEISPNIVFNHKVLTSLINADSFSVILPGKTPFIKYNNLGGDIIMNNASISYVRESYIAPYDSAVSFLHPGLFVDIGLLNLSWNVDTGKFTTLIPDIHQDISEYTSLSIWLATNPSSSLNAKFKEQSFIMTIKDDIGRQEHILLKSQNALEIPNGKELVNKYQSQWSTFTPLSNIRIPLDILTKINKKNIASISLNFNQTQSGSIYVGDIRFLK
ncbi:hypothetical protein AN641_07630 [Candidatus Epulonipiscioides gigas]|nr:hypothetical protein AN641_07630 [Epulopiscium sp. SCG-C07WGA-EpuloA2]